MTIRVLLCTTSDYHRYIELLDLLNCERRIDMKQTVLLLVQKGHVYSEVYDHVYSWHTFYIYLT